jgi:hypothetical protein
MERVGEAYVPEVVITAAAGSSAAIRMSSAKEWSSTSRWGSNC